MSHFKFACSRFVLIVCILLGSSYVFAEGPLKMAAPEFPPYTFMEQGQVRGIAIDVVAEALRRCNQSAEFFILPWARVLEEVKSGKKDGVVAAARNTERERYLNYCPESTINQDIVFFASIENPVTFDGDTSKLSGRTVILVFEQYLGATLDNLLKTDVLRQKGTPHTNEACIRMLILDRADFWPAERSAALWTLKNTGLQDKVHQVGPALETLPTYTAFTKVRDMVALRNAFEAALKSMKQDGTYEKIFDIYLK